MYAVTARRLDAAGMAKRSAISAFTGI